MLEVQQQHRKEMERKDSEHKKEESRLKHLVEKLCVWFPLAKEILRREKLCLAVGFSTEQTRNRVVGREVTHNGTLYSEEHRRNFTARNVNAKIRQEPKTKRFVLHISGTPIGEWFRELFNKLKPGFNVRQSPKQNHFKL